MLTQSNIVLTWQALASHADGCDICLPYVARLVKVEDPRRTDFEVYDHLCETGKELFTSWRLAKDEYLAGTWERRERQFITDDQLKADRVTFELRSEAIMSMPAERYKAWLALPDDRRHAQLLALEEGFGHKLAGVELAKVEGWQEYRYRWRCLCGADGGAESAAAAREEYELHAGKPQKASSSGRAIKICEGPGCDEQNFTRGRFHRRECRLKWEAEHGC